MWTVSKITGDGSVSKKDTATAGTITWKQVLGAALVAGLLALASNVYDRHWYLQNEADYTVERFKTSTTFIRNEIRIVYYKKGRLSDVLPKDGWVTKFSDEGLVVYRLDPSETFDFDATKLSGDIAAREILDCDSDHGLTFCITERCVGNVFYHTNVSDIMSGADRKSYASFAYMEQESINHVEEALKLPFKMDRGKFEQAFISNGERDVFYTVLHSNPWTYSLGIQLVGKKYWLFFRSEDYLRADGFKASPHAGPNFATKAPTSKTMDYFTYESQPGDLLFFPPNYAHAVASAAGPNAMINFRKPVLPHLLRNLPLNMFHNIINLAFFSKVSDNMEEYAEQGEEDRGQKFRQAKGHTTALSLHANDLLSKGTCSNNDPDNIDRLLAKMMKDFMREKGSDI